MDGINYPEEELRKETAYYKKQLDKLSGQSMRYDLTITTMRHSLKQKNDTFAVLTSLQKKYTVITPFDTFLAETIKAICTNLSMDRAVALVPSADHGIFKLHHHYGYPAGQFDAAPVKEIYITGEYLKGRKIFLINKKTIPDDAANQIQKFFAINYFVGMPVWHDEKPVAFIIAGRLVERPPFSPVLDKGDADSLIAILGLISAVLQNKKSVELELQKTEVQKENEIITAQRNMLEKTLKDLKAAQSQLIQSEKMASLGELTAGIAHEIQNPLNFVNNFSEVSRELLDEMKTELDLGNTADAKEIAADVIQNLEKITQHGKRADAIVKGMLQHSRSSSAVKEPTDINVLADEYIRLCYHGLRAKDKSFNATIKTDFDPSPEPINIIPQDIGRVILNLLTNAFYAVNEKKKQSDNDYEPTVTITTTSIQPPLGGRSVAIKVSDNGGGIPQRVLDKIFQPFFTTMPTGQGTGLGLSLSYDIITKGHAGELKVETKEGEGTTFTISLPINSN